MLARFMFEETNPAGLAIKKIHFIPEVSARRRSEFSSYMILDGCELRVFLRTTSLVEHFTFESHL